jgi:hypothetical protein
LPPATKVRSPITIRQIQVIGNKILKTALLRNILRRDDPTKRFDFLIRK